MITRKPLFASIVGMDGYSKSSTFRTVFNTLADGYGGHSVLKIRAERWAYDALGPAVTSTLQPNCYLEEMLREARC